MTYIYKKDPVASELRLMTKRNFAFSVGVCAVLWNGLPGEIRLVKSAF